MFTHIVVYDGNGEGIPARRLMRALIKENRTPHVKLLQGMIELEEITNC